MSRWSRPTSGVGAVESSLSERSLGRSVMFRVAVALAIFALAGVGFQQWNVVKNREGAAWTTQREIRLLELRAQLARVQLDEMNLYLMAPLGLASEEELSAATRDRVELVDRALDEFEDMSTGLDSAALQAGELLQLMEEWGPVGPDADLVSLYEGTMVARYDAPPPDYDNPTPVRSLGEALLIEELLDLTIHESVVAMLGLEQPSWSPDVELVMTQALPAVRSSGGGFLGSPERPLDGAWIDVELAQAHESATLEAVTDILAGSHAVDMNRWLEAIPDEGALTRPPVAFADFVQQADGQVQQIRDLFDQRLAALGEEPAQELAGTRNESLVWLGLAIALLAIGLTVFCLAMTLIWSRSKTLRQMANTDPLTGVGNRNQLNDRTTVLLGRADLHHHIVVTIDVDHFKVTNDTYGHAVGDRMLVHLAAALQQLADSTEAEESTVVRLGGDEFLLSLHSSRPIIPGPLAEGLDRLRCEVIQDEKLPGIRLDFSYGMTVATGSPGLTQLMDASDLAAYEEKAVRRLLSDPRRDLQGPPMIQQELDIRVDLN